MSDRDSTSGQAGSQFAGAWWKASRYELHDGLIRPVPGAPIDLYDPWAAYAQARAGWGGNAAAPPYAALLELVWQVRLLPQRTDRNPRLSPESEELVLKWCSAHGLLGIVLQETEAVYHAPRWRNAQVGEDGRYEGVLQPVRTSYTWGSSSWDIAGWTERDEPWSLPAEGARRISFDNENGVWEGQLVPPELVAERWRPEVLVRTLVDGAYATRPLDDSWGPFFPSVRPGERSTHRYPWPGSERWWYEYVEPVDRFLETASVLFESLTGLEASPDSDEARAVLHYGRPTRGQILLHGLLQGVRPMLFRSEDDAWIGGWRVKSLPASYAMMAYLDLIDGKRILGCDTCGKPYVSGAYQARYCSDRCRNTALKRAYRNRLRERDGMRPGAGD
jgi:hypothetical protein